MGAGRCVGFDFAEAFLAQGRELAAVAGPEAEFVQTEISAIPWRVMPRSDIHDP